MAQGTAAVGPVAAIEAQRPFMGAGVVRYASGRFQASLIHDLSIADIAAITGEVADLRINPNQIARLEGVVFRKRVIIAKSLDVLAQTQLTDGQVAVDRDPREATEILHNLDCFFGIGSCQVSYGQPNDQREQPQEEFLVRLVIALKRVEGFRRTLVEKITQGSQQRRFIALPDAGPVGTGRGIAAQLQLDLW